MFLSATAPTWSLNGPNLPEEHIYGSSAFFSLFVEVDDKNSSRYIAKVSGIIIIIIISCALHHVAHTIWTDTKKP